MGINPEKSLYKQLEEMMSKIDKLLLEISHLKLELSEEKENNKKLVEANLELTNKLSQALEELDKERSKNNKNSGNSSKPSSTDIAPVKKEKSGANLYNYRVKSDKKKGGLNFFFKKQVNFKIASKITFLITILSTKNPKFRKGGK